MTSAKARNPTTTHAHGIRRSQPFKLSSTAPIDSKSAEDMPGLDEDGIERYTRKIIEAQEFNTGSGSESRVLVHRF